MPSNEADMDELYSSLRLLAVQDPRAARQKFQELLDGDPDSAEVVLGRMAAPGEGRLRQLVANLARHRADRSRFAEHFERWLAVETDQFAHRAISAAVDARRTASHSVSSQRALVARDMVEMYRYVSERLRHELQNALLGPKTRLLQLLETVKLIDQGVGRAQLESLMAQLQDEFQAIGRMVEFEPNDPYFTLRPLNICEWVEQMNVEYGKRYSRVDLNIDGRDYASKQPILASDYLLRLVFWNLWVNAHQAAGQSCAITLDCGLRDLELSITIADNGPGFPADLEGVAFENRFSHSGPNRGRGLLEVQDAMEQLHGNAHLVETSPGVYRVRLLFTMITP